MDELTDRELMVMFKHGRREAFEVLFGRYRDHVWSYLRRLLGDGTTAEDLTQDTFLAVIRSRESYEPQAPFKAWLFRIATNAARSNFRRRERMTVHTLAEEDAEANAAPPAERPPEQEYGHELSSALEEAVGKLPGTLREVFLLHQVHGLDDDDIAGALELAPASIRVYLHRARKALYERLRPLLGDFKGSGTDG
jgi:RNA polymerase sigma-70 factor (ECF subfamily)